MVEVQRDLSGDPKLLPAGGLPLSFANIVELQRGIEVPMDD